MTQLVGSVINHTIDHSFLGTNSIFFKYIIIWMSDDETRRNISDANDAGEKSKCTWNVSLHLIEYSSND